LKGLSDAKEHTRLEENLPPYYNVFMLLITSRPLTIPFVYHLKRQYYIHIKLQTKTRR